MVQKKPLTQYFHLVLFIFSISQNETMKELWILMNFAFSPFYPLYNYTYLFLEERNMSHNHEQRKKGW